MSKFIKYVREFAASTGGSAGSTIVSVQAGRFRTAARENRATHQNARDSADRRHKNEMEGAARRRCAGDQPDSRETEGAGESPDGKRINTIRRWLHEGSDQPTRESKRQDVEDEDPRLLPEEVGRALRNKGANDADADQQRSDGETAQKAADTTRHCTILV